MESRYSLCAQREQTPFLPDHGVPHHNVLHRISGAEFAEFHSQVGDAAKIARRALDATTVRESANEWRKLFGDNFPPPPDDDGDSDGGSNSTETSGFTPRQEPTIVGGGRYA